MLVHNEWLLTPARIAVHSPTATAVLADLHLGYNDARRRDGEAVPPADLALILAPLQSVIATHDIRNVVIAGDLFEAGVNADLAAELVSWLTRGRRRSRLSFPAITTAASPTLLTAYPSIPKASWSAAGAWFTATVVCQTAP